MTEAGPPRFKLAKALGITRMGARRSVLALAAAAFPAALVTSMVLPPRPLLLWNASPSSPVGLYAVTAPSILRKGDLIVAWPPPKARRMAAARSYLPFNVPLVTRVAAVAGDRDCARGNRILINGRFASVRRESDPSGRQMPRWSGCVRLRHGEKFLLSSGPLAFDGRYFGVTRASEAVGKARLLWTR